MTAVSAITEAEELLNDFKNAVAAQDRDEMERLWHRTIDAILGSGWRCFHCGAFFTDQYAARLHFGSTSDSVPDCFKTLGQAPNNRLAYGEWLRHGETLRKRFEVAE